MKLLASITIGLALSPSMAIAKPQFLSTDNKTNDWSNAYVNGTLPSPYPSAPHNLNRVPWYQVIIACTGHWDKNKRCSADIKMKTDSNNPVMLGKVTMDLKTGDITPKELSANGYTFRVTGVGQTEITQD